MKTWVSTTEGLGLNSPVLVQSRILVTLYEVAHGMYPAAYISIGATVRAADALVFHPESGDRSQSQSPEAAADVINQEDSVLIWCGILILDRYADCRSEQLFTKLHHPAIIY